MIPYILAAIGGYLVAQSQKKETFADGGETYFDKQASIKGGVRNYSVDIDTEDGEQIRDLEYKSYEKAKKVYDKYKKSMEYDGETIEDIQLIVQYKNGDYDSIGGQEFADGGETGLMTNTFVNLFKSRGFKEKRGSVGLRFFEHKPTGVFITFDPKGYQTPVIISTDKSGENTIYEGSSIREVMESLDRLGITDKMADGGTLDFDYSKISSVEVDGIDTSDYPDFVDAYISYAEYDGEPMTDEQIEKLNQDGDFVYEAVINHLFSKGGITKETKDKWIQDAIKKKGSLRATAKRKGLIKGEEKLSMADLKKLEKEGGKTAKRAHLAETLKKIKK